MADRIVSLLPSATEIVCALGARDQLVGVSHECDHPAGIEDRRVLTSAKFPPSATSAGVHDAVQDVLRRALAVYDIDTAALAELDPDVVVTQDLCDVCAVSFDDVCAAVAELTRDDVRIVNLKPQRLADIWADIRRTAAAIDRDADAVRLLEALDARIDEVRRRAAQAPRRPRVLSVEWIEPVMIGGMWMPEMIEIAGGEPMVTVPGDHAPTLDRAALEALEPDVVLIKPCGFPIARTLEEIEVLRRVLPWDRWRAVREGAVYLADGNAYFNRPGPRIVDSLEILAACVHPERFADLRARHADAAVRVAPDLSTEPWAAGTTSRT